MKHRDEPFNFNELLHPAQAFESPWQVVDDADLTLYEKRAILSSWASDACTLDAAPWLREFGRGSIVGFDEIMDALRAVDKEQVPGSHGYLQKARRRKIVGGSRQWEGPDAAL